MTDLTSTIARLRELMARKAALPDSNERANVGIELDLAGRSALPALLDAAERADRMEKERDMLPKGSVVVPVDDALLAAERNLDGWLCQFCNEVADPADDVESWRDGIISALRGLSNAYDEWYKLRPHLDSDLLAARPGAPHD